MNLIEELQSLDMNEPGRWPLVFRIAAVVLVFVAVSAFGIYMWVYKTDVPDLRRVETEEVNLRSTFENRQRLAASFDAYRDAYIQIFKHLSLPTVPVEIGCVPPRANVPQGEFPVQMMHARLQVYVRLTAF